MDMDLDGNVLMRVLLRCVFLACFTGNNGNTKQHLEGIPLSFASGMGEKLHGFIVVNFYLYSDLFPYGGKIIGRPT